MTGEKLRELHRAEPFRLFRLHLADGRSIEVRHPELMAISASGRIAVVFVPDAQSNANHHIDTLMITDVELSGNGQTPGGNIKRDA